jgi:hypothetical protein
MSERFIELKCVIIQKIDLFERPNYEIDQNIKKIDLN